MRRAHRFTAGLAILIGLALAPITPSAAEPADSPATLSGISAANGQVNGTLSVRGESGALTIDPASVTATVGGVEVPVTVATADVRQRQAMIVFDTSGSMRQTMADAQEAAKAFVEAAPVDVQIGLVSFANVPFLDVEPTDDRDRLVRSIDALEPGGETALYAGMSRAIDSMDTDGDRSIVLLSDGAESVIPPEQRQAELELVLAALRQSAVRAETIAYETDDTNPEVREVLSQFASAGGGSVAQASDADSVRAAFTAAAQVLDAQAEWTLDAPPELGGAQEIVIEGLAGTSSFRAVATTDLGAVRATPTSTSPAVAAPPSAEPERGWTMTSWLLPVAVALFALGLFGLVLALNAPAFKSMRARRLESIASYGLGMTSASRARASAPSASAISERLVGAGERVMEGRESTTQTMALIERADLPWRAGEWLVLRIVAIVVGIAAFFVIFRSAPWWLAMALGALTGFVIPSLFLRWKAARRAKAFEELLPDVLMLVATSLSSGFSLPQALDAVTRDASEPARKEFARALAETRIGMDVPDALDHMSVRMKSVNMEWATMAIRIQRQVGGNLAETLKTTAKTLREREALHRQVRALSAEGRLSAYVLIALPIGMLLYSLLVNYEYVSTLWTHWLGWVMMILGIIAMVVGVFWMRKVVQIEV